VIELEIYIYCIGGAGCECADVYAVACKRRSSSSDFN